MSFEEQIFQIRSELKLPLPGRKQQYKMAPAIRGISGTNSGYKKAGVLICLFPGENDLQLVFIKRNEYDGPHSGQVSLPGGVYEEEDGNLIETAIRETKEEIGIKFEKSAILGSLSALTIPVSNMEVQPYVGYFGSNPVFIPEKREVQYLIISGLKELADPSCIHKEKWLLRGQEIEVPFYRVKDNIIWGATAMIICEFLEVISRSGLYRQSQY